MVQHTPNQLDEQPDPTQINPQLPESRAADPSEVEDVLLAIAPYYSLVLSLLVVAAGAVAVAVLRPDWISAIITSASGVEPKAYWYLSRASGLVAFVLLWASMALGLAITNKMARAWPGGPTIAALHDFTSLLGLGFGVFHALILTGDRYTDYTLAQVLVPFASVNYRPLWVGLGQVGFYLMALVTLSFYVRRWIGYKLWRALHYLSFGVFVLALVHGLMSGTDSGSMLLRDMYWVSATTLGGLIAYRVARARQPKRVRDQRFS